MSKMKRTASGPLKFQILIFINIVILLLILFVYLKTRVNIIYFNKPSKMQPMVKNSSVNAYLSMVRTQRYMMIYYNEKGYYT